MADRAAFPPPPGKSALVDRAGLPQLAWLNWFGALSAWLQRRRVITAAVDWAAIPAGNSAYVQITVTNAALGDFVVASLDPADRDIAVTAQVTAADTVTIWATNHSGGAIDLAAGTTRILLEKAR